MAKRGVSHANRSIWISLFIQNVNTLYLYYDNISEETGAGLVATIQAIQEGDCVDHTTEVLEQMTNILFTVSLKHLVLNNETMIPIPEFLKQMKLIYNYDQLHSLMLTYKDNDGRQLCSNDEAVEVKLAFTATYGR